MYIDAMGNDIDFLHFDLQRQQIPQMYQKLWRVSIGQQNDRLVFTLPLDKGYGFLLRRLSGQYTMQDDIPPLQAVLPPIAYIELFDTTRGRTWQNEAYPARLVLTQADQGYSTMQPAAVDTDFWSVGMEAKPVKNKITYNNYYAYRQTLKLVLSFAPTPVMAGFMLFNIIFDGYLIPELGLEQWQ